MLARALSILHKELCRRALGVALRVYWGQSLDMTVGASMKYAYVRYSQYICCKFYGSSLWATRVSPSEVTYSMVALCSLYDAQRALEHVLRTVL